MNIQKEIICFGDTTDRQIKLASLRNELLEIANRHEHREFKNELDKLCQVQIELTRLQVELEQQAQIEALSK